MSFPTTIAPTQANKNAWIQTFTGAAFSPLAPRSEDIRLEDIAAALSKMCRYAGHCIRFYSVAEHSVLVAEAAPDWCKLDALLHDASEAYLVDIPRPLKPHLVNYVEIENNLMAEIADRFGTLWPLPHEVKQLDARIIADERAQNMVQMNVSADEWGSDVEPIGCSLKYWTPEEAQAQFTAAFYRYGGKA